MPHPHLIRHRSCAIASSTVDARAQRSIEVLYCTAISIVMERYEYAKIEHCVKNYTVYELT